MSGKAAEMSLRSLDCTEGLSLRYFNPQVKAKEVVFNPLSGSVYKILCHSVGSEVSAYRNEEHKHFIFEVVIAHRLKVFRRWLQLH